MLPSSLSKQQKYLFVIALLFIVLWSALFIQLENSLAKLQEFGAFFFLGIGGAITANSTGAGGGVVFVPSFNALGMAIDEVVATSFAIQCFGMTVGSISWLIFFNRDSSQKIERVNLLYQALACSIPMSIAGIYCVQYLSLLPVTSINTIFSVFSLVFGIVVLYHCVYLGKRSTHRGVKQLTKLELLLIAISSFIGGIITAWISVGVGEILAVILLLRGFSVMFSVAAGVIVSSLSVLSGIPYFINEQLINLEVLLFAAPGAIIGALVARFIAQALGPQKLKLFLGSWILFVGVIGLIDFI
ncbi:sulfite exporter TauE/SafE family protein [Thalassotalea psychrophila]|uniref:Probable membrane transporter protein n=1 Tax=Thalassotalea psychrophila TaxID=3065647 RepID=A0ABY9TU96_9GAMM|nr:sulfite exporter TauE/SafE family protein [Colwelliaceae bacterium SQ149]